MCIRLVFLLPPPRIALMIQEPCDFHCSPPAFHAVIAWPVKTMATPSPLCLSWHPWGVSQPAVSTILFPTWYTALPIHLVSWRAVTLMSYQYSSLMTRSFRSSDSRSLTSELSLAVSTVPPLPTSDLTSQVPKYQALLPIALLYDVHV